MEERSPSCVTRFIFAPRRRCHVRRRNVFNYISFFLYLTQQKIPCRYGDGVWHVLIKNIDDNAFTCWRPWNKRSGCFWRYCLQFCASLSSTNECIYGIYISTLWDGWVFVDIRIVQSYLTNGD